MSWLFDRAMARGVSMPTALREARGGFVEDAAIVIDVREASDFWRARADPSLGWSAIPTYAPGASGSFFLETVAPANGWNYPWRRFGAAIEVRDLWTEAAPGAAANALALEALHVFERVNPGTPLSTAVEGARWLLEINVIGDEGAKQPPALVGLASLAVQPNGRLARIAADQRSELPVAVRTAERRGVSSEAVAQMLGSLLFAWACLHVDGAWGGAELVPATERERAHGRSARHAVLHVDPLLAELRKAGADQPHGLAPALAACRAIFAPTPTA